MSSSTLLSNLDVLVEQGKKLPNLLRIAKHNRYLKESVDVVGEVKKIVTAVGNAIKNPLVKARHPEESIDKLVKKIELALNELVLHDPENKSGYENLIKELGELQCRKCETDAIMSLMYPSNPLPLTYIENPMEPGFDSAFGELSGEEQQCLRCLLLFPAEAEIKRRDIIHFWVGMGLTDSMAGDRQLAKLVETGLIKRRILNQKLLNRYKMPTIVRNKLLDQESNPVRNVGSWHILNAKKERSGNNKALKTSLLRTINRTATFTSLPSDNMEPEALLNANQGILNSARLKTISGMHKLKVVHLGGWNPDSLKYIVFQDNESFQYLKSLKQVRFLSLEGVSGIEKLPEVVYELRQLKVLDLRTCSNLETLPPGIGSLKSLTHLDLCGCILLDHVPLEIILLTNLQVLKGFIVSDPRDVEGNSTSASSPCPFGELSKLNQLRKLTIINRRDDFPTEEDFQTLCLMEQLSHLRIVWMLDSISFSDLQILTEDDRVKRFPATLRKLDLQSAPEHMASRVLSLISHDRNNCRLEKLYIRGGGLQELKQFFAHTKVVRLRFLHQLQIQWHDLAKLFPNLSSLEIFDCPNLISFPCDANGVWELPC